MCIIRYTPWGMERRTKMKTTIEKLESAMEFGGTKKDIVLLIISAFSLLASIFRLPLPFDAAWIAILLCGVPIILEAVIGLITKFDIKADVLVSLALIASICIGEDFAAGEVAFIMQLGALLEDLTVSKARAGIEKLVKLTPQTARLIKDGNESIISAQSVKPGDILRVNPGETIPADGIITSGQTSVNQAVMTGESLPVDKSAGDEVSSGTVNQFGTFEMKATKAGTDSSIQRMIRLVQSADAGKAKIVGIADRWATWIVVIALSAAALTWLFTGQIIRAVTILVVFCPCALVLATPTAIMAAIGNATKHGFLVREGDALERLAKIEKITFDKTGTLTYGTLKVVKAYSLYEKVSENELYSLCASAESRSDHPIGKAIVRCYNDTFGKLNADAEDFVMIPGCGVSAKVENKSVAAGNEKLLERYGIKLTESAKELAHQYILRGCTVIYIAACGTLLGFIALSDTVRNESPDMVKSLKSLGVEPILLTGDSENSARTIAQTTGICNIKSGCLPENKLEFIKELQSKNQPVCMIGDGVNDAPALKAADVGIAMGGIGSDIAIDAADIALIDDEVKEIPHIISLSRHMMTVIKLNMTFSMALNFVAIILAMTGTLNPVIGALVHNAGSVLVISNSALLLKWRKKQ